MAYQNNEKLDATLTLRIPRKLKKRLEKEAKKVERKTNLGRFTTSNYTHALLETALSEPNHVENLVNELSQQDSSENNDLIIDNEVE